MENPQETKKMNEFEFNSYAEKTGCPSLRTILAYQDKSVAGDIIPRILTLTDAERVDRSWNTLTIKDSKTGKTAVLGPNYFPAELYFELHFRQYGVPNRSMPSEIAEVKNVPQTARKFFDVYQSMKNEGIDIILRCPGNNTRLDIDMNFAKPAEFVRDGDILEGLMRSPNKPILVDLVHDNEEKKFKQKVTERCKNKVDQNTRDSPRLLIGDLKLYDSKGHPIIDSAGQHKRKPYEHLISKIEMPGKPELLRYLVPYNESNLGNLQTLLADKLVTYLSRMHAQVPAVQRDMAEQKANKANSERLRENTITHLRNRHEKEQRILEEINLAGKRKKGNIFSGSKLMF